MVYHLGKSLPYYQRLSLRPENSANTHELSIPVLFMTAACTLDMKQQLSNLTGLNFDPHNRNIFWPNADGMMNISVMTKVIYSTRPLHSFQSMIRPLLLKDSQKSFVFYANSKALIDRCSVNFSNWLDTQPFHSDYLKLIGPMKKEEKFHITKLLCAHKKEIPARTEGYDPSTYTFNPQSLFATSGAANTGIDNPQVHGVFRVETPPSVVDCLQEKGRVGRRKEAAPSIDFYIITISLESVIILLQRIYSSTTHKGKYQSNLFDDLKTILTTIVIPKGCINLRLARLASNPYSHHDIPPMHCGTACSYCIGDYKKSFRLS